MTLKNRAKPPNRTAPHDIENVGSRNTHPANQGISTDTPSHTIPIPIPIARGRCGNMLLLANPMELRGRRSMYRSMIHVAASIVSKPTESEYKRAQSGEVLSHSFSVVPIGTKKGAIETAQMRKNKPDFQMIVNDE